MGVFDFLNSQQTGTLDTTTSIDPQIKQAYLSNLNFADTVASRPYQQYGGPRIAGFSEDQNQAFQNTRQAAQGPQNFLSGNIQAYQNPYQQQVINQTMQDIERQRTMADQGVRANAIGSNAFGGTREAIARQENNRNFLDTSARTLAQLRNQGFDTAANLMNTDINRSVGANQALLGQGNMQQQQVQRNFDMANQDFQNQFNYPLQQLAIRQGALGANIPNAGQTQSQPLFENKLGNLIGVGQGINSLFGQNNSGGNSFLGGAVKGIANNLSGLLDFDKSGGLNFGDISSGFNQGLDFLFGP